MTPITPSLPLSGGADGSLPDVSVTSEDIGPVSSEVVSTTIARVAASELMRGKKGADMSNTPRHIDLAVLDAMETREEAEKLLRIINDALADGEVTSDEALRILQQAREVLREAQEDVTATERANVAELVTASVLRKGKVSKRLLLRARDVGLDVAMPVLPVERGITDASRLSLPT